MSHSTSANMFESFNSKPSLSWADEMNELAETNECGALPMLPEWTPSKSMNLGEEDVGQGAPVGDMANTSNNLGGNNKSNMEKPGAEKFVNHGENGVTDGVEGDNFGSEEDAEDFEYEHGHQHLSDATTSSDEEDSNASNQELSGFSSSGNDGDPTSEDDEVVSEGDSTYHQPENVQHDSSINDTSASEGCELGSSEEDQSTSSASGDDDDPTFAPCHPGWTKHLSPSINPNHSTPPEVNRWAFSPPIGYALQRDLDSVYLDEDCPNLVKPATLSCALLHTDSDGLGGYAFPYGARGLKRPLPQLFPRRRMVFPRHGQDVYQRSRLSYSEVVKYGQQDHQFIGANASKHNEELSRITTQQELETELSTSSEQLPASGEEMSEHSSNDAEGGDDLWSPTADDVDQDSNSSVHQDEYMEAKLQVSEEGSRSWNSVSEPDLETDNIFDLGDQATNYTHFTNYASHHDPLAYLDLAVICTINFTDGDGLSIPDSDTSLEATSMRGSTIEDLEHTVKMDYLCDSSSEKSQSFDDVSDVDVRPDTDKADEEKSEGVAEEDVFREVYELAVATALLDVDFVKEHVEDEQLDMIDIMHDLGDEEKTQVERVETEEEIGHLQGPGVGFFGGLMAAATFLWDCLNDRPLILDNP